MSAALDYLTARAKPAALVTGFAFAVVGFLWSYVVTDRLGEEIRQLSNAKAELRAQMDTYNRLASDYFIANQQGDLIFMLALQGSARQELSALVYKGNLLDRATPVRNMIGALALAGQLDYRTTYDAYEKLNDETRSVLTLQNFQRLKQAESTLITQGTGRVPALLERIFQLDRSINADEAAQKRNRLLSQIASMLGALILLCVNLLGTRTPAASSVVL